MWWHCADIRLPLIDAGQGSTPIDLTGLTVGFHLMTVTDVTVDDAENALVSKEFIAAVVDTAGRWLVVKDTRIDARH